MKRSLVFVLIVLSCLCSGLSSGGGSAWAAEEPGAQAEHAEEEHHETLAQKIGKWFNFFALATILYLFLSRTIRVQDKFKGQAEEIRRSIEGARLAKEEAEQKLAALDQRMLQMNEEIDRIKSQAAQEAEVEKRRIIEAAENEAARIVEMAHREIEAEVRVAQKQLRKHVADLAIGHGRKIVKQEINEDDHQRLIHKYIEEFGK